MIASRRKLGQVRQGRLKTKLSSVLKVVDWKTKHQLRMLIASKARFLDFSGGIFLVGVRWNDTQIDVSRSACLVFYLGSRCRTSDSLTVDSGNGFPGIDSGLNL